MPPFSRDASRKTNIGFAIIAGHVHGKIILVLAYLKASMVMNPRKKPPPEQLHQSLVRFTTPDKHSQANAVAGGVSDRHSMSHIFGRETEGAGNAVRSQVLHSDQTNAHDGVPVLSVN